jgi:hypothetical protein
MCSACFNQQPDKLHIDFEAAWDGPVKEGAIKVPIDDLYICEDCLKSAYGLLDPESEHVVIKDLTVELNRAYERGHYLQGELEKIRQTLRETEPVGA